ncbi:MAG: branched-chain amino acid ABC transporter permease [Chloroflexota bacterium]|jgi:branched-chain amino acid transport system permease protein|nr:branched-chain amino acid ABC transporter permease [Chloroflexota bacterium]
MATRPKAAASSGRARFALPALPELNPLMRGALLAALLVVVVVGPALLGSNYITSQLTNIGVYAMLGLGLNIVVGYAGLLDLGYAAFFAIGAYVAAYFMTTYNWPFWLVLPVGALVAAIFGVLIGAPTLRLRSDYLAIVTLGFGEITRITATNLDITGGPNGLVGVPPPAIGGLTLETPLQLYYLILALMLVTLFCVARLANSRIGRAWAYIREDELAAAAMGIDVVRMKLLAYALGAVWGGLAGCFLAVQLTTVAPESFTFNQSVQILIVVVLGGLGSIPGVILGAVIVVMVPSLMQAIGLASAWPLFYALALIALMVFRPEGLWPSRQRRRELHSVDIDLVGTPEPALEAERAEV